MLGSSITFFVCAASDPEAGHYGALQIASPRAIASRCCKLTARDGSAVAGGGVLAFQAAVGFWSRITLFDNDELFELRRAYLTRTLTAPMRG